ncbi:MAG: porin [Rhodobacteraceae bacterium]|nr:porin [Paracoccaceae bacterium]
MKKLLLASTALVLSAGVAAADVRLSGDARMGIVYDNGIGAGAGLAQGNNTARLQFTSRARVTFTMSGETDGGMAFGASFRADQAGAANGNTAMTGGSVFISGEFGRLRFGDVAGAARAAVGDLYGVGLTGLGDLNDMTYLDRMYSVSPNTGLNRRTSALYDYSIDAFTFYASVGQQRRINGAGVGVAFLPNPTQRSTDDMMAIGASYSMDGLTVSAGYEMSRMRFRDSAAPATNAKLSANHLIIGVEYAIDDFMIKAIAGRVGGDLGTQLGTMTNTSRSQYGLSVSGDFDATTVTAFVNRNTRSTDYGIGASYDLGGGASLMGGISRQGSAAAQVQTVAPAAGIMPVPVAGARASRTRADLGLNFSF